MFIFYYVFVNVGRFIFLEYSNPKDAAQAVKTANGYQLDKKHIFDVSAFSDFEM